MRILVAPDKFKGSLSAREAAETLCRSLREHRPGIEVIPCPVADGGDGTLEVLRDALGLEMLETPVLDPLGRERPAFFGLSRNGGFAVVEMARASGLGLLSPSERDPMRTSTFGTGQLILKAVQAGAREVFVALGGSATVDGGLGLLQAMGAKIASTDPLPQAAGGGHLSQVLSVDPRPAIGRLEGARITGLCDVVLPLAGPTGAALFMPQKGADPETVRRLTSSLEVFERLLSASCGRDLRRERGTGAAGGAGLAILAMGGTLEAGFDRVALLLGLEALIGDCDAVVTGEGYLDEGSLGGKAPVGVARLARKAGKPCVAVCGAVAPGLRGLADEGFTGILPLLEKPLPAGDERLRETAARMGGAVDALARRLEIEK